MPLLYGYNHFSDFRGDFLKDTGLKNVDDNMELYIQYVTARFADINNQFLRELLDEVKQIPKTGGISIGI